MKPVVRVLVVDDYQPFRRFVCESLEWRPEFQVICEATDGLQAVQKAEELQHGPGFARQRNAKT